MNLLSNFPHTADGYRRVRTNDEYGGSRDSLIAVFTNKVCWAQPATASEINDLGHRGTRSTQKVYFLEKVSLDAENVLEVTYEDGSVHTIDIVAEADPDATAGLGVVYKTFGEERSVE